MKTARRTLLVSLCAVACVTAAGCSGGTNSGTDSGGNPDVVGDPGPGQDGITDPDADPGTDPGIATDTGTDATPDAESDALPDAQEDPGPPPECEDTDGDGYGPNCEGGPDCAPEDSSRHAAVVWYADGDYDGFGAGEGVPLCVGSGDIPPGWSDRGDDCDDGDPATYPGAPEIPDDGVANACEGEDLKAATADGIFVIPGLPLDAPGTREEPVGSLSAALDLAMATDTPRIFMAHNGTDESLWIDTDVAIHGGYQPIEWTRSGLSSYILATDEVGVRIVQAHVLMTKVQIRGFEETGPVPTHREATALSVENGRMTMVDGGVWGGSIVAEDDSDETAGRTGLDVTGSRVTFLRSNIGSGTVHVRAAAGVQDAFRATRATAARIDSGSLTMVACPVEAFAMTEAAHTRGEAFAGAHATGLNILGGEVLAVRGDIYSGAQAATNNTDAVDTQVQAHSRATSYPVRVSGEARVWLINSVLGSDGVKSLAGVWAAGSAGEPIQGEANAELTSVPLLIRGGLVDALHCHLYADSESVAQAIATVEAGSIDTFEMSWVRLVSVEDYGSARIINSVGQSEIATPDSALFHVTSMSDLTLWNSVAWDNDAGVCRVFGDEDCLVDAAGALDDCDELANCTAADSLVTDPLWDGGWNAALPGSPLRDQGLDPATLGLTVPNDIHGTSRPQGAGFDIGTVEFQTP